MSAVPMTEVSPPPPWYRQFWPWFLIAIPLVSVLLGVLMIALATGGHDALVVDDWYKEGKGVNRRIERDLAARRLGLSARFERVPGALVLELGTSRAAFEPPASVEVRWVHATRAARDGAATLAHVGGARYATTGTALPEDGRWRIHVEPTPVTSPDPRSDEGAGADARDAPIEWRLVGDVVELSPGSAPSLVARSIATPTAEDLIDVNATRVRGVDDGIAATAGERSSRRATDGRASRFARPDPPPRGRTAEDRR